MIDHILQGSVSPPVSVQIQARASPNSSSGCDLSDHETHSERSIPSSSSPTADDNLVFDGHGTDSPIPDGSSTLNQKNINSGCNSCRSAETIPVVRCIECSSNLCDQCEKAHKYMRCFENHRMVPISSCQNVENNRSKMLIKSLSCSVHSNLPIEFYCRSCCVPICVECMQTVHSQGHDYGFLEDEAVRSVQLLNQASKKARGKLAEVSYEAVSVENAAKLLPSMYNSAVARVDEIYQICIGLLNESKMDLMKDLQITYNRQLNQFGSSVHQAKETIDKFRTNLDKIDQLLSCANPLEILISKPALLKHLESVANYSLDIKASESGIRLESNTSVLASTIRNAFGQVVTGSGFISEANKLSSIDRVLASSRQANSGSPVFNGLMSMPPVSVAAPVLSSGIGKKFSELPFTTESSNFNLTNDYFDINTNKNIYSAPLMNQKTINSCDRNGNGIPLTSSFGIATEENNLFRNPYSDDSIVDALSTSVAMSVLSSEPTDVSSQFGGLWSNRLAEYQPNPNANNLYGPIGTVRLPEPVSTMSTVCVHASLFKLLIVLLLS